MGNAKKISVYKLSFSKVLSVLVMCTALLFLTGANYFIYSIHTQENKLCLTTGSNDNEAHAPLEEKSKSSSSFSIQEEYLHDKHSVNEFARLTMLLHRRIHDAEKLTIVHYELISPPPKG